MSDLYIFFGHGWNTDKTFDISHFNNIKITMMKEACLLFESREFKHLQNAMKVGIKDYTRNDYLKDLYEHATEKFKNKFCTFDSEEYTTVPNLLLTVYKKDEELVRLQKIGDVRPTKFPQNVMLLSELVEILGDNFTLIVYTCRGQLDTFQMQNITLFGDKEGADIINKIMSSNINILEEPLENPPCKSFTGGLIE